MPSTSASGERALTGGEAIVEALRAHGVEVVFGIPGVQTYGLFDALARSDIRVIAPKHEQATAYMAFGYAKASGRPGVCAVVPGVGFLNASAALASAYGASTPVLCLTGEVPSPFIGSGLGHLHELPDQLAMMRGVTKWAARADHPADAERLVAEAFQAMRGERPRPAALAMPWDVFDRREPVGPPVEPIEPAVEPVDEQAVERAAELLRDARAPMIMVGSGAVRAGQEVRALAELLQAPVVSFRGGRGIVSDEHPLGLNCAEGFRCWAQTDVVVGIGSRMELDWFRWGRPPEGLRRVLVDVDPTQVGRLKPDVAVIADAADGARALAAALAGHVAEDRTERTLAVKAAVAERAAAITPHVGYLGAIRRALPRDGFFVEELCQAGFTSYFALPVYEPRTFVTCGHQGTLGFGYATALGVKVARPDAPVVSIAGDGGLLFALQELLTAAQYGIGVVCVLFDNAAYGNVWRDQQRLYEGRTIASELRNPDWIALAESCGVASASATTPEALERAVADAIAAGEPALIVVPVDRRDEVSPWPLLMPRTG
ncbi:MAG TPA: thiamine pyrophosphate-binding protein [Solirubrobacteraceae bacterium]|nr:thiamine pyrophosphate-binding protein [Solirubrobacteraceae bacterium]